MRTRSPIVVLVLCVTLVLAGCSGTSTSANDEAVTDTSTPISDAADQPSGEGESSGDDSSSADDVAWQAFEFDHPATYTYDTFMSGDGEGTLVWEVTEVNGDEVTVSVDYQAGETSYQSTVSGTKDTVRGQLMMSPAGSFLIVSIFSPTLAYYEDQTLEVGQGWSYSTQEGSASFEITGKDTYAGIDCYASEMKVDGNLLHEGCFSSDLALATYTAYYEENGELTAKMELTSYEAN